MGEAWERGYAISKTPLIAAYIRAGIKFFANCYCIGVFQNKIYCALYIVYTKPILCCCTM